MSPTRHFIRQTSLTTALRPTFATAARPAFASIARSHNFHTTSPRMTVHNVKTNDEWKEALAKNSIVILDCFATWCGPCKAISPILANFSNNEEFKNLHFVKVDVDELPDVSQELGIRAMPTFMVFKDGNKVDELVGANPKGLESLLQKAVTC